MHGRQTHGAQPWAGIDPIVAARRSCSALQTIVSRRIDVTAEPAVVTVGTFQSGTRNNIVPDEAVLSRHDPHVRSGHHRAGASADARHRDTRCRGSGATADCASTTARPMTFNDAALAARMRPTLERVFGAGKLFESPRVTVAEDFAAYQQEIPGLFFFIGARPPDVPFERAVPNHSPQFFVDERAMRDGVRVLSNLAVDYLGAQ